MRPAPLPLPAIHASHVGIWIADAQGRVQRVGRGEAIAAVAATPHLLLNATLTGDRLGYPELSGLDLLELFAFLYPARFAVPTPAGIAATIGLPPPRAEEDIAAFLPQATAAMLAGLADPAWPEREGAWHGLQALARQRWPWAPLIQPQLSAPDANERWLFARLPEWEEQPPRAAPRQVRINPDDVTARLDRLTGDGAERRPGQQDYAKATAAIFEPRERKDAASMMLVAEAGTGVGKTLGYLAPATQWIGASRRAASASRPLPRRCNVNCRARPRNYTLTPRPTAKRSSSAKAVRITSACSIWRTRCKAAFRGAPRSWRSSLPAGRLIRATATWSAAICPAGCPRCSAATVPPHSPTGAASASMPVARISANASSNARHAPRPRPTSSSPTTH